jgi:gas vesicle protein
MTDDPDVIRAEIESTRRNLSGDVDALADKVTPSKIADRQKRKVKGAFHSFTEKIMGSDDDEYYYGHPHQSVAGKAGDAIGDAKDATVDAGRRVVRKAEGNPVAVGLIAFGVGLLAASLIPASDKEQELAAKAKEAAQPVLQEAAEVGKQVANDLKEPAQEAVESVKETAQESVEAVRAEAADRASDVSDDAREAGQRVSDA